MFAGKAADQVFVQGFSEARVRDRAGEAVRAQLLRRVEAILQMGTKGKNGYGGAFNQNSPLANFERFGIVRNLKSFSALRELQHNWTAAATGAAGSNLAAILLGGEYSDCVYSNACAPLCQDGRSSNDGSEPGEPRAVSRPSAGRV